MGKREKGERRRRKERVEEERLGQKWRRDQIIRKDRKWLEKNGEDRR